MTEYTQLYVDIQEDVRAERYPLTGEQTSKLQAVAEIRPEFANDMCESITNQTRFVRSKVSKEKRQEIWDKWANSKSNQ